MLEGVVKGLITLCILVLCVFLVIWVLGALGVVLPDIAIKILWIIIALIAILVLYRTVKGTGWIP